MINVRGIANNSIQIVNRDIEAKVYKSLGVDYSNDGLPKNRFEILDVMIQRQQLTQNDILFINSVQLQGNIISVYVRGHYDGVNRIDNKSPDIFLFENKEWKVIHVPEQWPAWSRVILCEQTKSIMD